MNSADSLSEIVNRAKRLAIVAELVASFEDDAERKSMVMALYEGGIITEQSADLFIESFGLEAA